MASHSKSFTAVLVGILVDEGKLKLDEPLVTYLPWLKKNKELAAQTLRHVLSHSTGLPRDTEDSSFWGLARPFPTNQELQTYFLSAKLSIESNTRLKYSNTSYALACLVLESVSGQSYEELASTRIIKPLKLKSTGVDNPTTTKKICNGYSTLIEGQRHPFTPMVAANGLAGVTGFHGTPTDFAIAFSNFILTTNLISRKTQKELLHPVWPVDASQGSFYCLGFTSRPYKNYDMYGHTGGYPGFVSRTFAIPSLNIAVSMVFNSEDGDTWSIARALVEILHVFFKERPAKKPLTDYEATFYNGRGFPSRTVATGNKLLYADLSSASPLGSPTHLIPTKTKHSFTIANVDGFGFYGEHTTITLKDGKPQTLQFASALPSTTNKSQMIQRLKKMSP